MHWTRQWTRKVAQPLRGSGYSPSVRTQIKMDATSRDGFFALLGLLGVLYGSGMAFFTWARPQSPYYPFFKARWRWVKASGRAAFVQVPLYLSLGGMFLSGAFHSRHAEVFSTLFVGFALLSVPIYVVDWACADES